MMPRLSFRVQLFLALLLVSAIPLALMTAAGSIVLGLKQQLEGAGNLEPVTRTWVTAQRELQLLQLSPGAQLAIKRHDDAVSYLVNMSQTSSATANLLAKEAPTLLAVSGVIILFLVAFFGIQLSRGLSGPVNELLVWTQRIRRREPLPETSSAGGAAEFARLRRALRDLQQGLEQARASELEAERLRAFSEVARRVAHEMKNPLTPIRLAVLQLSRGAPPETRETLDVIAVESARLETMAREFAELGRLPEGVAAPVDLRELLDDLLRSTVPDRMTRQLTTASGETTVAGFYDPLRRAFANLLLNAVEACHGEGTISVHIARDGGMMEVRVSDTGVGIAPDRHEMIFQPYYTEKGHGTGLGLTIVRQTIEQHGGSVSVENAPSGGATFVVRLPG